MNWTLACGLPTSVLRQLWWAGWGTIKMPWNVTGWIEKGKNKAQWSHYYKNPFFANTTILWHLFRSIYKTMVRLEWCFFQKHTLTISGVVKVIIFSHCLYSRYLTKQSNIVVTFFTEKNVRKFVRVKLIPSPASQSLCSHKKCQIKVKSLSQLLHDQQRAIWQM